MFPWKRNRVRKRLHSTGITRLHRSYGISDSHTGLHPAWVSRVTRSRLRAVPSPTTHFAPPSLSHATPQRDGLPVRFTCRQPKSRSGLRHIAAGSTQKQAESSLLSYGPAFHLRLLSTPPFGDAVTFDYGPERVYPTGTFTPLTRAPPRRTTASVAGGRLGTVERCIRSNHSHRSNGRCGNRPRRTRGSRSLLPCFLYVRT